VGFEKMGQNFERNGCRQAAELMNRAGVKAATAYVSMVEAVSAKLAQTLADGPDEVHLSQLGKLTICDQVA
jgi:hypothetical protein